MRALLLLALGLGCTSAELASPRRIAREGAATRRVIKRLVTLPATCGGMVDPQTKNSGDLAYLPGACTDEALAAADAMVVRALLDQGFGVIGAESVAAILATSQDVQRRSAFSTEKAAHASLFESATPTEQSAMLKQLGAEGLVNTRVFVGATIGLGQRRSITVQVRLRAVEDGALVWARRCEVEVGGITKDADAIAEGTKCALEAGK